jgi:hypothetical protein
VDRVGRLFPFTVALQITQPTGQSADFAAINRVLNLIEGALYKLLENDSLDDFESSMNQLNFDLELTSTLGLFDLEKIDTRIEINKSGSIEDAVASMAVKELMARGLITSLWWVPVDEVGKVAGVFRPSHSSLDSALFVDLVKGTV